MPKETSSTQFNARLPLLTHSQINALSESHGLTKTQVVIIAIDRLARDLEGVSSGADKDVKRLKTVARVVPEYDLGQEE